MDKKHFENKPQFPSQTTKELEVIKLRGNCCYYQTWSYSCYSTTLFQLQRLYSIKLDNDHRWCMHNDYERNGHCLFQGSNLILKKTTRNLQTGGNLNNNLNQSKVLAAVPTQFWYENVLETRHAECVGGKPVTRPHMCMHDHQTCQTSPLLLTVSLIFHARTRII